LFVEIGWFTLGAGVPEVTAGGAGGVDPPACATYGAVNPIINTTAATVFIIEARSPVA